MSTPRRYELSDFEWSIIQPLLPNKPRGVPRADDRKVLNGIYWRLRTGSPWADIPERYGPPTTCANRFRRWGKIGVWDRIFEAVSRAYDGDLQMIDSSSIRVHQHGANGKKGVRRTPPLGTELTPAAWGVREAAYRTMTSGHGTLYQMSDKDESVRKARYNADQVVRELLAASQGEAAASEAAS